MTRKTKEVDDKTERQADDDVAEHSYYYDDAHGYEEFDPDRDDEADNEKAGATES